MRKLALLCTLALAGCATTGPHEAAPIYLNVDLIDRGAATQAQRAPQVEARLKQADHCGQQFRGDFAALVAAGGDLVAVVGRGRALDAEFDRCIAAYGLTGWPEFKLGGEYLRTPAFLRSWAHAGAPPRSGVLDALMFGWTAGGGSAAIVPPATTVSCTSYRLGTLVQTTCK